MRAVFAVVGHPNKGKSSIVSTLARNDGIEISQRSGTTSEANKVRVETLNAGYELVDTPGFQRPHKVLAWLQKHDVTADQRAATVAKFVADAECQKIFPDEVELLRPLVQGAAILYVVDGSRPYGAEYEAEMEILRWSGQSSMALINPIENTDHVESWSNALAQYFKTVRVFNPMKADFEKQTELLTAFAHLKPEWSNTLHQVTQDLLQQRQQQASNSAVILARLLEDLCSHSSQQKVLKKSQAEQLQPLLSKNYREWMTRREKQAVDELFANYAHYQTQLALHELQLPPDLFDCEQWYVWGLNKTQLMAVGALTGAAAGAAADMMVAGHSFMLGAIGGSLFGAGSAWLGANKLVQTQLKGLPLGGYQACYGPISNKNFPYVVIGRFIYLFNQVSQRNHAVRSTLTVDDSDLNSQIKVLEKSQQKALHLACENLIKQKQQNNLVEVLIPLFSKTST